MIWSCLRALLRIAAFEDEPEYSAGGLFHRKTSEVFLQR